jgi:hypothetical protein
VLNITGEESLTLVPGLEKTLPEGSFVVSASVEISATSPEKQPGFAGAECELMDKAGGGGETKVSGAWASTTTASTSPVDVAVAEIPLNLAVHGEESKLSVKCKESGHGTGVEISVLHGSLIGTQTSVNK